MFETLKCKPDNGNYHFFYLSLATLSIAVRKIQRLQCVSECECGALVECECGALLECACGALVECECGALVECEREALVECECGSLVECEREAWVECEFRGIDGT